MELERNRAKLLTLQYSTQEYCQFVSVVNLSSCSCGAVFNLRWSSVIKQFSCVRDHITTDLVTFKFFGLRAGQLVGGTPSVAKGLVAYWVGECATSLSYSQRHLHREDWALALFGMCLHHLGFQNQKWDTEVLGLQPLHCRAYKMGWGFIVSTGGFFRSLCAFSPALL